MDRGAWRATVHGVASADRKGLMGQQGWWCSISWSLVRISGCVWSSWGGGVLRVEKQTFPPHHLNTRTSKHTCHRGGGGEGVPTQLILNLK